jgi:glycolate oxidase FAD binding subunit
LAVLLQEPVVSDAAALLREAVGADAVATGDATWRFSCSGVIPSVVVSPPSVEGVAETVRAASQARLALVPSGNGAHLSIGWPPRRYDAALSLRRLNRLLAHEAGDMTVTVEAGTTLAALNEALAHAGQWLPIDPPREEETTVGGLIAADRNGPLRLACGKVRDYLIGIRVVTAGGAILRGGGRVVKNVAGYDLPKLFVGSFGTLGAIVEATFKVRPRPAASRLFVWHSESIEVATRRGLELLESTVAPVFAEAINAAGAEAVGLGQDAALLVGCAGSRAEVAAQASALQAVGGGAVRDCDPAVSGAVMKAVRAFSHAATEDALVARVSVLPAQLPALLQRFESEAVSRALLTEIAAHAGSGVAWCQAHAPQGALPLGLYAEWMRIHTRQAGGWIVFEHVPPDLRDRLDPWGFSEPSVPLMVKIKRALDPGDIFSPGRFVGGI